jgi:hypothetical protein
VYLVLCGDQIVEQYTNLLPKSRIKWLGFLGSWIKILISTPTSLFTAHNFSGYLQAVDDDVILNIIDEQTEQNRTQV